ncbi:MAG: hypothetical protein HYS12_07630 [Planctomycetes bacterium]|nr:hypothetical protein [Planctomycetota bacterium]
MRSFLKVLLGLFFVASGYGGVANNLRKLLDPAIGSRHLGTCLPGILFGSIFLLGGAGLIVSELLPLRKRWRQAWADIKGSWKTYVLLAGSLVVGLVWLLLQLEVLPSSRTIPPDLTVQAVEAAYPELFKHVYEQAKTGGMSATEEEAFDKILPPEVIGIQIGRNGGYCVLGYRMFCKSDASSFFPRLPTIGTPVLNQYWYSGEDGSRKTVIVYEALVPLQLGPPREIIVCFDLKGLQERLHAQ